MLGRKVIDNSSRFTVNGKMDARLRRHDIYDKSVYSSPFYIPPRWRLGLFRDLMAQGNRPPVDTGGYASSH